MRLRITHEIGAAFETPLSLAVREIRMTPRTYDGQYVGDWRLDVDSDCRLDRVLDPYGNVVHDFSVTGPIRELTITATGEVEVDDSAGVLQASTLDRVPPAVFLRETPLTVIGPQVLDLATSVSGVANANPLDRCHALMASLRDRLEAGEAGSGEHTGTCDDDAETVLAAGTAGPAGTAHGFIAAARAMRIPARFVSGYLWRDDGGAATALHAWAEAFVDGLGWVGFDTINDRCPTDAYVRVAVGLDQHGAAWIRGANHGGNSEVVTCRTTITRVEF